MPSARSIAAFLRHFSFRWLTVVPRILYRITLSCVLDPRGARRFIDDASDAMDFAGEDRVLGSCEVQEILPGGGDVTLKAPFYTSSVGGTCRLLELGCLAYAVKNIGAKTIFEIGTFTGRTTRVFAMNAATGARIVTLDLPQDRVAHVVGRDFEDTPEASRIEKVSGDSASFDYSPWHGRCDFVWIDGNHDYEYVVRDTETAVRLCRPGGWIGWHDYWHASPTLGVTRAVRQARGRFAEIRHLRGTTIVMARMKG